MYSNVGLGADPSKPPCKKAKQRRLEKRQEKLAKRLDATGQEPSEPSTNARSKVNSGAKCLEELIVDFIPGQEPKHRLEVSDQTTMDSRYNKHWYSVTLL